MSKRLVQAMADLDEDIVLQEVKEYFLSELIMSAEVFNEASQLLREIEETKNEVFVL